MNAAGHDVAPDNLQGTHIEKIVSSAVYRLPTMTEDERLVGV